MIEIIVVSITTVEGIVLEALRRSSNKRIAREELAIEKQNELMEEIKALRRQVEELRDEVDEWKEKYFLVLRGN